MNRTDIINYLIKTYNYSTYLEIGLDDPNNNYNLINCKNKECVDPFFTEDHRNGYDVQLSIEKMKEIEKILTYKMTSDNFFKQNKKTYDIIFIDGLHLKEQVNKDIINSLKILNKNGKIVVHDCLPNSEGAQIVPRKQIEWNGDVWKAIPDLRNHHINFKTVNTDYGCCIIDYKDNPTLLNYENSFNYEWDDFIKNKNSLLNIISINDFLTLYK